MHFLEIPRLFYFPCLFIAFLISCSSPESPESDKDRPNVVLIMTDDQGWGDFHINGNDTIDTPVLDQLSKESVTFDRFYVSPVCAPTRASLLTGRYALRTGTTWVTHRKEVMRAEELTLAEVMKKEGYKTGIFGKWHNGEQFPNNPKGQGFDEFYGFASGHWNNYFDSPLEHNGKKVKAKGYITDVLTDQAIKFIDNNKEAPFLCYIPYNVPHSPYQVPEPYFKKYKAFGLADEEACIYGMCENMDQNVGKVLSTLDSLGLRDNTIVVFLTDNGPNTVRYNGHMKGKKGHIDEGGVRVPLYIRWPQKLLAGRVVKEIAAHIDVLPTLADLCGIDLPDTLALDGKSLVPLMETQGTTWEERNIYTYKPSRDLFCSGAVRNSQYRYVYKVKGEKELYDMVADPSQTKDLATEKPEVLEKMHQEFLDWYADVTSQNPTIPGIPIGFDQSPNVHLPAHEARVSGKAVYAHYWGWANDWVSGWVPGEEHNMTWQVDAVADGIYELEFQYHAEDNATVMEVAVDDQVYTHAIEEPYLTEAIKSPDWVARDEAPDKVWGVSVLNKTIELKKGSHQIKLYAKQVDPKSNLQIKAAVLTKKI